MRPGTTNIRYVTTSGMKEDLKRKFAIFLDSQVCTSSELTRSHQRSRVWTAITRSIVVIYELLVVGENR
eukprot:752852-Hanusia_phi.AAC.3